MIRSSQIKTLLKVASGSPFRMPIDVIYAEFTEISEDGYCVVIYLLPLIIIHCCENSLFYFS